MSDLVIDASLALQWFLEDETDRGYSLAVLERLARDRAIVPLLWFYEVGNGLTVAYRRRRITFEQVTGYLVRIRRLPIWADEPDPALILALPDLARTYELTSYDAAYLELAVRRNLALATTDHALRRAAEKAGVKLAPVE
ncbi:MAG TPA: type II toxin-antitoxin system VapC family toxin [Bryobacteraceae bacterium]|nr:type II toxin-antitoxin system VapC family toxin [Bryobacteraceae bacterium]